MGWYFEVEEMLTLINGGLPLMPIFRLVGVILQSIMDDFTPAAVGDKRRKKEGERTRPRHRCVGE